MAKSGSYKGTRDDLHIIVHWSEDSQSIANNTTTFDVWVSLYHVGDIRWVQNPNRNITISVAGSDDIVINVPSKTFTKTGTNVLTDKYSFTVKHDNDGTKKVGISAEFTRVFYGSGNPDEGLTLKASGTATLDTIARATEITSASFSSNLAASTANSLTISLDRKNTAFRHNISIRDGSNVLKSVTGQTNPTSITLDATEVNGIINRMGSVTNLKKNFTVRVVTKASSASDAATIGTRNLTITGTLDNASTRPSFSSGTSSVHGDGFDSSIDRYVQTISRASLRAVASPGQGASMSSMTATINNNGTVSNNRSVNTWTGTTGVLNRSGSYRVTVTATNSRGQTNTRNIDISVLAYSPPSITTFTVVRTTGTNARVTRATSYSSLSGLNQQRLTVERRPSTSTTWTTMTNSSTGWLSMNINNDFLESGNTASRSYVYLATVEDKFGNTSTSQVSLSTNSVLMSLNKDIGIGIGKIHERGVLDIAGDVYINGDSILDMGEGNGGYWIRLHDGTQICYGTNIERLETTTAVGSIYRSPSYLLYYARSFVGLAPALMLGTQGNNGVWMNSGSVTTSASYVQAMSATSGLYTNLRYVAVGRWK